jgi:hypothetical protein
MDEDGSGALTAGDLKTQPLGLKRTVAAADVAALQLQLARAVAQG